MSTLTNTLANKWSFVCEETDETLVNTHSFLHSAFLLARELEEQTDSEE